MASLQGFVRQIPTLLALCGAGLVYFASKQPIVQSPPADVEHILARCAAAHARPGPLPDFFARDTSDRYDPGTPPMLILDTMLFTGEENGTVVKRADLLLENGLVKSIGDLLHLREQYAKTDLQVVSMHGAWVTPGLVDLHSHLGVLSMPVLDGAANLDSPHGPILPWLRSIDAFSTHDNAFALAIAGGVTSAQILPGSANAIGGEGFMIKLRATHERTPASMAVELPHQLNASAAPATSHTPWRHMKQACGGKYGTRMDTAWALRAAYAHAQEVRVKQDAFCGAARAGLWQGLGDFPAGLQWELLVDVLRGKVKVTSDCSQAVDLDALARLTNEFGFRVASVQQASDAWLVPDLLKRMWGGPPALSLFATNHRRSLDSYRSSEFAPDVLAHENLTVVLSTSHPILPARDLIQQARQAHHFGLNASLALAAITSAPAHAVGMGHRLGALREHADADLVAWSAHPLQPGAVPLQVWIDGIAQFAGGDKWPEEGRRRQREPRAPEWAEERRSAVRYAGEPPLGGRKVAGRVVFENVRRVVEETGEFGEEDIVSEGEAEEMREKKMKTVVVEDGSITCVGEEEWDCDGDDAAESIDLEGGVIAPGMFSYGSPLGMGEIADETSTQNGRPLDALQRNTPAILGDAAGLQRAADGLICDTRDALTAYRSGITYATTAPSEFFLSMPLPPLVQGLSVTFRTGCFSTMERGTLVQEVTALHVRIGHDVPMTGTQGASVGQQIALLRRLLHGWEPEDTETGKYFKQAAEGVIPLVVDVESADIMATLLVLKAEVENRRGSAMRVVFAGAGEAPLLARDIARGRVGVLLTSARPAPVKWEGRRVIPGPPLTAETGVGVLLQHGVTVGVGVRETWDARNTRFEVAQLLYETPGLDERTALQLVTSNVARLLGFRQTEKLDLVAYRGGYMFQLEGKVVGVLSQERGFVDMLVDN
ncbi:hypothetical protein HDZ31DRAFT_80477 [Schizophyllum fasciatum]